MEKGEGHMRPDEPILSVDEARERLLSRIERLGTTNIPVHDALGCVLSQDIVATEDNPPFDNSAMDGFAVRSEDVRGASEADPVTLRIIETVSAGLAPSMTVSPRTATRIMTGAMVPDGADAVVMVEETRADGHTVFIQASADAHQNIRDAGGSVRAGDKVLDAGAVIRPAEMAMLAALNVVSVPTFRKPKIAVLSTGDELTPLGEPLKPGKIRDSNRYGLIGQILDAGAIPIDLGVAIDDPNVVEDMIRAGLDEADALVTSGGVSMGELDVVRDVLEKLGKLHFWRVAMKPGKPQAFGDVLGKPVFALPGNPVSSMVVFELFVRPALLKMAGHTVLFRRTQRAIMDEIVVNDARGRTNFMRVVLSERDGRLHARTTGEQGSGILRSLVLANGLATIGDEGARIGDEVDVISI